MPLSSIQQSYVDEYNAFGVIMATPMVDEVLENKHGVYNPVTDVQTDGLTIANFILDPLNGLVNDVNVTFDFGLQPSIVVVNGASYRVGHGWSWNGTNVVLDSPAGTGGDVYALI